MRGSVGRGGVTTILTLPFRTYEAVVAFTATIGVRPAVVQAWAGHQWASFVGDAARVLRAFERRAVK